MKFNTTFIKEHRAHLIQCILLFFLFSYIVFLYYWISIRTTPVCDDLGYAKTELSLEVMIVRFVLWSQRTILEIPLLGILKAPYIYNLLFCALLYPIFTILLAKILRLSIFKSFLTLIPLVAFQNLNENESVGVVTTHFNYLLPLITAMWSVVILRCNKIGLFKGILLLVLSIFSTSNEMLAVAFIVIFPFLYFYDRKHKNWYIAVIGVSIFHLCLVFISGAGTVRLCVDSNVHFPDFENLSLIYKFYQATVATVFYYTTQLNFYSLFLVFTICYCYFRYQTNALKNSVLITVIIGLLLFIYGFINITHSQQLYNFTISQAVEITTNKACALMCVSVIAISALLYMLLKLNCNYQIKIIVLSLLVAAFAIRMTMAFSPTIFFSRTRTFFISNLLILLASCYLLIRYEVFNKVQIKVVILILGFFSLCYQYNFLQKNINLINLPYHSYAYNFSKCALKYKKPIKYANEFLVVNKISEINSILDFITPKNAYTSLKEKEILKNGNLRLLRIKFSPSTEDTQILPSLISPNDLDNGYLINKGMLGY